MILKFKNNYSKYCLIAIFFICVFKSESVFASREPIIRVLISKNNNLRIRSDRSIPLTIEGEFFISKKIKGLTLKNEKNRKILYFDKNKQKKYDLKSNQKFQVRTSDDCDNLSAREETFLVKDGTPELVPKKVIFTYL